MDKTVSKTSYDEHLSLFWVLNHNRFVKPDKKRYQASEDYWGFFPVNRPQFKVKDLTLYSDEQLDSISNYYDVFFYADAYGVYSNEWFLKGDINERSSLIYGGANFSEAAVMERMFQQRKLVIGEFNLVTSPTPYDVRRALEDLFQFRYTGWTLRYYDDLDTLTNTDIPNWMVQLHNESQRRPWDYKGSGLAYVNESGIVLVLTEDDLISELPVINTKKKFSDYYNIPEYIRYPFWQDITIPYSEENVMAYYKVHPNERGDSILNYYKIPKMYPAVIGDSAEGLRFYFCGDFSDNPFGYLTSYFKGITFLRKLFYNNQDFNDRRKFFWEYYQPMVKKIFYDYYFKKDRIDRTTLRPLPKRAIKTRATGILPDFEKIKASSEVSSKIDTRMAPLPYGLRKMDGLLAARDAQSTQALRSDKEVFEFEETTPQSTPATPAVAPEKAKPAQPEKTRPTESTAFKKDTSSTSTRGTQPAATGQTTPPVAATQPKPTETRTMPTIETRKEKSSETPVESDKPFVSQKAFIDRLVVLTKSGAFVSGREYFQGSGNTASETSSYKSQTITAPRPTISVSPSGGWKLIVASFTSEDNARTFASGNPNFEIIRVPGTPYFRIALKTYSSLREAKSDIATIKDTYPDAWLLRI